MSYDIDVELTDTFGGEANYCWVKRAILTIPCGTSKRAIMRRCKAAMGITGERGRTADFGDMLEFRPYGRQIIMLAHVRY